MSSPVVPTDTGHGPEGNIQPHPQQPRHACSRRPARSLQRQARLPSRRLRVRILSDQARGVYTKKCWIESIFVASSFFPLYSPAEVFSLSWFNLWLPVSVNYQYNLFFSFSIIHCPRLSPCLANRFSLMCLSLIRLRFRFSPFFWTGFCFNLATFLNSVNSTVPFHWKEGGIVVVYF